MKTRILVLATGGTIASELTPSGLTPALTPEDLVSYLPEISEYVEITTESLYSIDSTNMTPDHWVGICKKIEENYEDYDGFVIAHGTDTMAYTAAALSYMIQNSPKPIVLTGAQKPIGMEITDAKANLRDSIIYAADKDSRGVQVVFDGKVIAGTRAKKVRTMSFAAFESINFPFLASIYDGKIIRYTDNQHDGDQVSFNHDLKSKVFLMKVVPGITPELIPVIFMIYDGIIIESFGAGGIPESIEKQLFDEMKKYDPLKKVVVMQTQVSYEGSNINVYEVGKKLSSNFDVLEAKDMTTEAVYTKLMWVLSQENNSWEELRDRFYKPIGCDMLF